MKILITGGAGFIASHISDLLIENNHDVIIIDNLSTGNKENINKRAVFYNEDLSDYNKIKNIFEKEKPAVVYHLAAQIDVRKSLENPLKDAEINILATINLLDACVKNNVKHFIFSSTGGAIYGETENIPTTEDEKELPENPYGVAKLSIEKYLNFYNKFHNLKYTCLRYSNVYGPRQNAKGEAGVIAIFFNSMLNKISPIIFGGQQTRDFVFVKDVAKANMLALDEKNSNTYNIGTGIETSITELFQNINSMFFNNEIKAKIEEQKKGEQKRSCLSYAKINKSLGWFPETSLEQGLSETHKWFKERKR